MNRPWAALGLVLALCVIMPRSAQAQGETKPSSKPRMGQNYPNPFNPLTFVDFFVGGYDSAVGSASCTEPSRQYRITMKVYNMLGQVVAVPVLQGGGDGGAPINRIMLSCGAYKAKWDGKTLNGREAASGIYRIVIDQDGALTSVQAIVGK
jgi:hypothetical protein